MDANITAAADCHLAVSRLLSVMTDLMDVLYEENQILCAGLPAGLSNLADRKQQLSDDYADYSAEVMDLFANQIAADPHLLNQLMTQGQALRDLTRDNMTLLESAMAASNRRIEAVMAAIRSHDQNNRTYGNHSLSVMTHFVPPNMNMVI